MGPKIKQRLDCQESSKGKGGIETCIGQKKVSKNIPATKLTEANQKHLELTLKCADWNMMQLHFFGISPSLYLDYNYMLVAFALQRKQRSPRLSN